jgi:predicted AAA+ superfamily ATPase
MIRKEILKEVLLDNREEVSKQRVIPRDFRFEEFGNYVFIGIRRAGKSFLLYQRIQEMLANGYTWDSMIYINFEDERLLGMMTEDLNSLLEVHSELSPQKPTLFLDEIQNVPGWDKFARRLADNKYRVYITGSNSKMLSRDVATTLGGRYITVHTFPYSFSEFLHANELDFSTNALHTTEGRAKVKACFNNYFNYGGFPEGATLQSKRDYLTSVYQKIYLGDIAARHSIENTFALRILFRKLAESIKQPVSFTRMASVVASTGAKIAKNTVINYIEYAKEACLLLPIQNIAGKLADRESNSKYYFADNGILSLLLSDANTSLLENLVAVTLLRKYGQDDAVFFYNKNIEVDFYIPDEALAIQVCYAIDLSDKAQEREVGALTKLGKVLECRRKLIITYDDETTIEDENGRVEVLPIWKWLLTK